LPITEYSAGVPLELQQIVFRLLAKDPGLRYQHASDLGADLRYALEAVVSGRVQYPGRKKDYSRSIAVLPFSNISGDSKEEYFCDGIAEEITNALAQAKGLRVAARTSTLAFRESKEDIREIGRKLHVETLLEGSVRRAGNRLRVTVQLIDVATGYHLWSERYDQETDEIFAIQDAIAQNVVRALQLILSEDERQAIVKSTTADSDAYDYYLRGRQFFHQRRRKSLQFARQMFVRAAEIDPKYALAYVGIADCCAMLVHFYGESGNIHLVEADQASSRALELDTELAQAHAARGFTLWLMDRFDEAKVEFETALEMDKNQAETRYLYGRARFQRGEIAEAAKLFEEACQGHEHHEARYFAAQAHSALGNAETANALYRLAFRAIEKHVELNPDDARAFTTGAVSLCRLGESEAGLAWARRAVAIDPEDAGIQYNVACLHALEGDPTRAIQCLEAAVKAGFAHRDWVEKDPDLDSLRDDPRFKALKWRE
jgi:adenylate cyclase